jgi:uncharacterized alkaline shock family protein YloU
MKLAYRLLSAVFAILAVIFAGIVLALTLGWVIPQGYLQPFLATTDNRWIVGVVCVLVIVSAIDLILFGGRGPRRSQGLLIQDTVLGRVDISALALEDMIRRASRQVREIREIRPVLRYEKEGLAISLNLSVSPDANLPAVSQEAQEAVQHYLEEKAGINVRQVQVLIKGVSFESRVRAE